MEFLGKTTGISLDREARAAGVEGEGKPSTAVVPG